MAGEHRQLGYFHMLGGSVEGGSTCLLLSRPHFVLLDIDRDGVIDEVAPANRIGGPGQRQLRLAEENGVRYGEAAPGSGR